VELRHVVGGDRRRHRRRRKTDQGARRGGKQGFVYVFDRITGTPVWPIEERPVPPERRAWREGQPDAAVPDEAAGRTRARS
jgi:glucose dehydrogenase